MNLKEEEFIRTMIWGLEGKYMENILNLQITVTDEQMTSLIKGQLDDLPDDKLQEILSNALIEFFKTDNGQKLFYNKQYYSDNPTPTNLLVHMVENAISKDLLKPCVDEFIETMKNNYENLIRETMIQTFSNMFFTQIERNSLKANMNMILSHVRNNQ